MLVSTRFQHFSKETSFHGFKRLFIGSRFRWPFWGLIITAGIVMCVYQIKNKMEVLIANPLNININMLYEDEREFPALTICSQLKIRVSFVVNNTNLMNLLHLIYQRTKKVNITDENRADIEKVSNTWTAKEFFLMAAMPREDVILWCRLPNDEDCSFRDFEPVITEEGYCLQLKKKMSIREAGRGNGMKLLLNLAQYEGIDSDSFAGSRLAIHEHNQDPFPSKGYDIMPGYQIAIVLRKSKNTQIGNCEAGNPLRYFNTYSYPACRTEHLLVQAAHACKCRPYTLPPPRPDDTVKNSSIDVEYSDCTVFQQLTCIERSIQDFSVATSTPSVSSQLCTGECVRNEFEHELYYNFFRDNAKFESMIGAKKSALIEAYQRGRDSVEFITFYQKTNDDWKHLDEAAGAFEKLIVSALLVPPYGTIPQLLLAKHPCLGELIFDKYDKNLTEPNSVRKQNFNASLINLLVKTVEELDKKIETLDVEDMISLAKSVEEIHLDNCIVGREDICSVGALYDMLNIRNKLEEKNKQMKLLLMDVKIFHNVLQMFVSKNGTLFQMYNQSDHEERDSLKHMLEYYHDVIASCLTVCNSIYERILRSGQPSMKTHAMYHGFLNELGLINETIYDVCKSGGSYIESNFSVSSTHQLLLNITHLLTATDSSNVRKFRYDSIVTELTENMSRKFFSYDYDQNKLTKSLTDIETMNKVLNIYKNLISKQLVNRTEFFANFSRCNQSFHHGIEEYKRIVLKYFNELETLFGDYLTKLTDLYPDRVDPIIDILEQDMNDILDNFTVSSRAPAFLGEKTCLENAKTTLNDVRKTNFDEIAFDIYRHRVAVIVNSLKAYTEDVKSLNQKFNQDNLGLVKIYFRDMSVKIGTQERAYDFLSFLCDFGGIMGLWLGGSFVALVEIFDLICFEHMSRFFSPQKEPKEKKSNVKKDYKLPKDDLKRMPEAKPLYRTPDGGLDTSLGNL